LLWCELVLRDSDHGSNGGQCWWSRVCHCLLRDILWLLKHCWLRLEVLHWFRCCISSWWSGIRHLRLLVDHRGRSRIGHRLFVRNLLRGRVRDCRLLIDNRLLRGRVRDLRLLVDNRLLRGCVRDWCWYVTGAASMIAG
jgi:hypothetical protein